MPFLTYTETFDSALSRGTEPKPRNYVICIDGTGQDRLAEIDNDPNTVTTNVLRLFKGVSTARNEQFKRYYPGVGSQESDPNLLSRAFGGITGAGASRIRLQAYMHLVQFFHPGDKLFIFGFSRGAAIARTLANHINKNGIPESITVKYARQWFRDDLIESITGHGKKRNVKIEMLGVWDTVASFGIPGNSINLFKNLTVASNVKRAYHLVSIDENRQPFPVSLMNHESRIKEIWFPGVHSDVGGGYPDHGLADAALRFMINRAKEHGLVVNRLSDFKPDPEGVIHNHSKSRLPKKSRKIEVKKGKAKKPVIHKSALEKKRKSKNRNPAKYAPQPLIDLNGNYRVDNRD